jgi:hypothetical protein
MKNSLFILCLICAENLFSKVLNIDREIESDSTFRRVRANFTFSFSNDKQKKNLVDFAVTTFVQFPMNCHFTTPRWFFDSNLFFTVNKHLEFTIHYDHNLDAYRPLPIDNYYYSISTGINIKF